MTNKEFGILELLARNKGQVFSREQIYDYDAVIIGLS